MTPAWIDLAFVLGIIGLAAVVVLVLVVAFSLGRAAALGDQQLRDALTEEDLDRAYERLRDPNVFVLPNRHRTYFPDSGDAA